MSALAGNCGLLLRLADSGWVAAFLRNGRLEYAVGSGEPSSVLVDRLNSTHYGDPHEPLPVDLPYASESCDIAAEVAKCTEQSIEGLAIGEACFNFCFPAGMELDTTITNDSQGRPTLRVFWEQW